METVLWYLAAAVCLLLVARVAGRVRHPFLALLAGAVCGVGTLALLALLEPETGFFLPINRFSAFVATVLGVPGVGLLLALRLFL